MWRSSVKRIFGGAWIAASVLMAASLVKIKPFRPVDRTRMSATRAQINTLQAALEGYKQDVGTYPTTAQGLKALGAKPDGAEGWNGPYLVHEVPLDPWGRPYVYRYPGEHGPQPDMLSYGADGRPGGSGPNQDTLSWQRK